MHLSSIAVQDFVPALMPSLTPPLTHGTAVLAHRAFTGETLEDLLAFVTRPTKTTAEQAALLLDASVAHQLHFSHEQAVALQRLALDHHRLFRVADGFGVRSARPFRLLALVAPGDLMINTPLDFITGHLDVQLDLLFVVPGHPLPSHIPDHDAAFFAVSESDPAALRRLMPLHASWPRPVLNNPAAIARLSRDTVATGLAGLPGLCSPPVSRLTQDCLLAYRRGGAAAPAPASGFPVLIRPVSSHAGQNLEKLDCLPGLAAYLDANPAGEFFVTQFVDYRGGDGMFRKLRVAVIGGRPFLCHMAASDHWMVHYLNAGMAESESRRADEAQAMAEFDAGFAARHKEAFAALNRWMGLDYFQIDCAETPDGRLLVFEVDVAAIIHMMDPPDLFPYKPAQMRRVFAGFDAMLRRHVGWETP